MKNKIFLVVSMIMLLACMLAVSVSAAANDYFGNVEIIDNNGDGASDINISDMVHTIIQEGDGAISSASARMTFLVIAKRENTPSLRITLRHQRVQQDAFIALALTRSTLYCPDIVEQPQRCLPQT